MRLLVAQENKTVREPRLPLLHMFQDVFMERGHRLYAIDFSGNDIGNAGPYERIFQKNQLIEAMKASDMGLFWANRAIKAVLWESLSRPLRRKVVFASYVWKLKHFPKIKYPLGFATKLCAFGSKAMVFMTSEQCEQARRCLPKIPIIKLNVGIDVAFYRESAIAEDVPLAHQRSAELLLKEPYIVSLGDQLRCDDDLLKSVKNEGFPVVRILQDPKNAVSFRSKIKQHNVSDRITVFEKISYRFLRFLLQHASAYAGFVDSSWQPAGWTVACEALASGLPVVLYDGLVAREMKFLGAGDCINVVMPGRLDRFNEILSTLMRNRDGSSLSKKCKEFAAGKLSLEQNSLRFAQNIEELLQRD